MKWRIPPGVDLVIALIAFLGLSVWIVLLALSLVGCGRSPSAPLRLHAASAVLDDPFEGRDYASFDDEQGTRTPAILIWKDGRTSLAVNIEAYSCGTYSGFPPVENEAGPLVSVSRAFVGTFSGLPVVGDTLGGSVVLSTVIDTFTVTGGRFFVTCVAPDTLEGYAWLRLPSMAACGRDSLARFFRVVRTH